MKSCARDVNSLYALSVGYDLLETEPVVWKSSIVRETVDLSTQRLIAILS